MTDKEALKLALEALELSHPRFGIGTAIHIKAVAVIKEALAQPEHDKTDVRCECCGYMTYHREHLGCIRAAKLKEPEQEPLTDEDRELLERALRFYEGCPDGQYDELMVELIRDRLAQPAVTESHKQEPVAWEGGEGWESLAWELCADENGEDSCNELIWEGGPIPEPWGDRWMKYEEEAKRLIALVQKHTTPPDWRQPQRTWVGLEAEDRLCAKYMQDAPDGIEAVIDYIEAKLKEKNT